jgi:glutathione peroxidase
MFAKVSVVGEDQHPLYRELTTAIPQAQGDPDAFRENLRGHGIDPNSDPDVLWNFEKFLIAADGSVVERFSPDMAPDDPRIVAAVEQELAATKTATQA